MRRVNRHLFFPGLNLPGRRLLALGVALAAGLPAVAHAWWNDDYKQRTRISFNTSAAGVETREALSGVTVPVRLHSGNFDFLAAKADGSDLRVLAGDDKTPLKFSIERFDGANELAVLWVQLPVVAPGSDKNVIYVYAGHEKAQAEATPTLADAGTVALLHFGEKDGVATDVLAGLKSTAPLAMENNGLIGAAARLSGRAVTWPASERVAAAAGGPYAVSLWIKPDSAGGTLFKQGPLALRIDGGTVSLSYGALVLAGGALPVQAWAQVAVVLGGGKAQLYVDGNPAAQADLPAGLPAVSGPLEVGADVNGLIDELQIATAPRSADWLRFVRAAQAGDAKLVASLLQTKDGASAEGGGEAGYIGILVKNLTLDAKIVIGLLGVMFVAAAWVMVVKTLLVRRVARGNDGFISAFRASAEVLQAQGTAQHPNSPLARLYDAGVRELNKRDVGRDERALSGASLDAVKAAVDADLVRENHKLNDWMVLLTIAISGGPFLGLLGTVVGVMITFAAIAAAGDVNVNAIAPGIAAALLATVAGLAVAIPALFAYNYLASRIKTLSADMQVFVDEFVTRVAERHGAR
jgi:biopolymer transport protein ExbB